MRGSGGARQGQNKLAPHCHDLAGRHDVADHQPFTWRRFIDGYDAAVRERVWKVSCMFTNARRFGDV